MPTSSLPTRALMPTDPARYFTIDDFTAYDGDRQTSWRNHVDLPSPEGGTRAGAILVELDVDGEMDIVSGDLHQTADLRAIERAIVALQHLHAALAQCYPEELRWAGRCMEHGDWGRCYGRDGHDGQHQLPTESDWRRGMIPTEGVSPASA